MTSKRSCTNNQADDKQTSAPALMLEQHTTIIMSHLIIVEQDIKLADFYDLKFEDQMLPEVVEQASCLSFL